MKASKVELDDALVSDERKEESSSKVRRGRGRPKTVVDYKEAKKKYNSDYYQRIKKKKDEDGTKDTVSVPAEQT
jgi:hypothetical protein